MEGRVVGPVLVALGVAEPGFVAPEDVVPVVAAGLDAVFLDEMPDDLFEGDASGREVETRKRSFERVVVRRGEDVEVAAMIALPALPANAALSANTTVPADPAMPGNL